MTNVKAQSSNQTASSKGNVYDLEERTARFGESVLLSAKTIVKDEITRPLIGQLVRSGTCIGANYMEADGAESKKALLIRSPYARKNRRRPNIGFE